MIQDEGLRRTRCLPIRGAVRPDRIRAKVRPAIPVAPTSTWPMPPPSPFASGANGGRPSLETVNGRKALIHSAKHLDRKLGWFRLLRGGEP